MKTNENFLPNKEDEKKEASFNGVALRVIAGIITVLVFIVILIVSSYFGIFSWMAIKVRTLTGLDMWLVKGVTFVLMAIFFGTPLSGFVLSFFLPVKNKKQKRFTFLIILAVLCFTAFFTSKNVYFDPATGNPRMYYSIGVDGKYKLFESDGFDPQTGDTLKPVTREIIMKMNEIEAEKNEVHLDSSASNHVAAEVTSTSSNGIPTVTPEETQVQTRVAHVPGKVYDCNDNVVQPTPKESAKTADTPTMERSEKVQKEEDLKKKKEATKKNTPTCGFIVSFMDNSNLGELDYTPLRCEDYESQTEADNCEVVFINDSKGTFKFYNTKRTLLFIVPPQKQTTVTMHINYHYFRASDQENLLPFRLPRRDKFFVRFSDNENAAVGKIFLHSNAGGRNSGARIVGQEEIMTPDNNRTQPSRSGGSGVLGSDGGSYTTN